MYKLMADTEDRWSLREGEGPLVAVAIHNGHEMRRDLAQLSALSDGDRLREEDPYTDRWTTIAPTRLVPKRSRFEVDLNRARDQAVYVRPEDAWGLNLWNGELTPAMIAESLRYYDDFYAQLKDVLETVKEKEGKFIVLDLHSYNHRRGGPDAAPEDPAKNPEVNVGTGTMERSRWAPLVDRFIADLSAFDFLGRHLDVRENVKFYGRQLAQWVHENFPEHGCCLALEFKKFWMDEWTGKPDQSKQEAISSALQATVPGLMEELQKL